MIAHGISEMRYFGKLNGKKKKEKKTDGKTKEDLAATVSYYYDSILSAVVTRL